MLAKVTTGSDPGGLFRYLLAKEKQPEVVGGSMTGETPAAFSRRMAQCAAMRPTVAKTVKHISVSAHPDDEVKQKQWLAIGLKLAAGLGYENHPWTCIIHRDQSHPHAHFVFGMVSYQGERVRDSWDKYRTTALMREIEQEFGFTSVINPEQRQKRAPSVGQIRRMEQEQQAYETGVRAAPSELPVSEKLQLLFEVASGDRPPLSLFIGRLQEQAVSVELHPENNGISYELDGIAFAGNQLHNSSLPKLQSQRGLVYDLDGVDLNRLPDAIAIAPTLWEVWETLKEAAAEDESGRLVYEGSYYELRYQKEAKVLEIFEQRRGKVLELQGNTARPYQLNEEDLTRWTQAGEILRAEKNKTIFAIAEPEL